MDHFFQLILFLFYFSIKCFIFILCWFLFIFLCLSLDLKESFSFSKFIIFRSTRDRVQWVYVGGAWAWNLLHRGHWNDHLLPKIQVGPEIQNTNFVDNYCSVYQDKKSSQTGASYDSRALSLPHLWVNRWVEWADFSKIENPACRKTIHNKECCRVL